MNRMDEIRDHGQKTMVTLLLVLHSIMNKVRREGLLAIEMDVENYKESKIFKPLIPFNIPVAMEFIRDMLRLVLTGVLDSKTLETYVQTAISSHHISLNKPEFPLLTIAGLTLRMFAEGHAPSVAVEFGRQAMPQSNRPSFSMMEDLLRDHHTSFKTSFTLSERAKRFCQGHE